MAAGGKNGKLPPAALVEVYQDLEAEVAKLRRLYLIIVHLQHLKRRQSLAEKRVYQGMLEARARWEANTTPIPLQTLRTVAVSVCLWVWTGWILVSSYGLEGQKPEVFGCLTALLPHFMTYVLQTASKAWAWSIFWGLWIERIQK